MAAESCENFKIENSVIIIIKEKYSVLKFDEMVKCYISS